MIFFKKINLWVQNESLEGKITVDGTVEKYKARFCVKGFRQKKIKVLLLDAKIISVVYDVQIHQINVKRTFLNVELEEEIYMEQPEGFVVPRK